MSSAQLVFVANRYPALIQQSKITIIDTDKRQAWHSSSLPIDDQKRLSSCRFENGTIFFSSSSLQLNAIASVDDSTLLDAARLVMLDASQQRSALEQRRAIATSEEHVLRQQQHSVLQLAATMRREELEERFARAAALLSAKEEKLVAGSGGAVA